MKYRKSLLVCSLTLAVVSVAQANDNTWQLFSDDRLDGIVETDTEQTLNYSENHTTFRATSSSSDSLFMGDFLTTGNGQIINFREVQDEHTVRYVGKSVDTGFQGTWYSTDGNAGDFSIITYKEPSQDSTYKALNISFVPQSSAETVSGDHNEFATGNGFWRTANTDYPIHSGQWYWEVEFLGNDFGTPGSYETGSQIIVGALSQPGTSWSNGVHAGYFYPDPGAGVPRVLCPSATNYGRVVEPGEIISVLLDMDNYTVEYAIDGEKLGIACQGLPQTVYPAVSVWNANKIEANFGQKPWVYPELTQ